MSNEVGNQKGQVRVYCCGGGGINIGLELGVFCQSQDNVVADIESVFIDTSKSNIACARRDVKAEQCYLIDGLDGSGKVRSENHQAINDHVRDILQRHKPMDLNIILSTGAGGSGSVFGPIIASHLLERKVPTIVFIIGSTGTRLEIENTLKTIKSYESIAQLRKTPVVGVYLENSSIMTRNVVDREIIFNILSLAILFSRQNRELDSRDLLNWLQYNNVTSFRPQLAALSIVDGEINSKDISDLGNIISVATVAVTPEQAMLKIIPDYQCVGIVSDAYSEEIKARAPYNFIISDGVYYEVAKRLQNQLAELGQIQEARVRKGTILNREDAPLDNGMVL